MIALAPARVLPLSLLTALCLASIAPRAAAEQPESFTFAFAPDTTVTWSKKLSDEQLTDFKAANPIRHQITESELHQRYARDEEGQWEMLQRVRSIEMSINGDRVENPMVDVILGHEIRLQLDEQGSAVGATGFRELMRRYERELDPAIYARVRQSMSAESLALGEVTKRNQSLAVVAGRSAKLGEKWGLVDRVNVQGTWSPVRGVVHFESWTDIDGMPGVKIVYRYDAAGRQYDAASDELTEVISMRPEDWDATPNNLGVSGQYVWVIDPATGQPLYENFEQLVTIPISSDLEGERGEIRSAHTWRWSKVEPTAD